MRYPAAMRLRTKRHITTFIAALFAVSLGLHGLMTARANAQMTAAASHIAMSSGDEPMDCPGHGGADQASCLAVCAGFIGVLFEPAALHFVETRALHADERVVSLSDRNVPPNPYPPRPSALI
jgi:hypothetical protein